MVDERSLIAELAGLAPDELITRIRRADGDEQRVLRIYFGPEQYETLQRLAMRAPVVRGGPLRGTWLSYTALMGSELSQFANNGQSRIWVDVLHLIEGSSTG